MNRHGSLNRIYRLVWSQVTNSFVAVAENARGRGKGKNQNRKLVAAALALSAVTWLIPEALAGPTGGKVVSGSAKIIQSKNSTITTVIQKSLDATIDWSSFNLAANETINFVQASKNDVAINDILGNSGSQILGHINAGGEIFLINPNGFVFGKSANVNVGGLVASALALNGSSQPGMHFSGTGTVDNQGAISAGSHVVLLGSSVTNEGTISAPLGTIVMGAGNSATLNLNNNQVSLKIDGSTLKNLISNGGLIQADGGAIILTAGAKNELLGSVVNNTGVVEARTVGNHNGAISLLADMGSGTVNVGGTLDASAADGGNGGNITTDAAQVGVANHTTVTTHSSKGASGTWTIDPTNFTITADSSAQTVSGIGNQTLEAALSSGSVSIATSSAANGTDLGDINVNAPVAWSNTNALTLTALNNINVNAGISWGGSGTSLLTLNAQNSINVNATMNGATSAGLSLVYAQQSSGAGAVNINAPVNLPSNANGGSFTMKQGAAAPVSYTIITSLGAQGSTTGTDLQGMNGNGNYVLGSNIDACATGGTCATPSAAWNAGNGFTPIATGGSFNGSFDGLGHTISNLYMNIPGTNTGVGLFATTGFTGAIRNVGLVNAFIQGSYGIGALVGYGYGTVSNSYVSGSKISGNSRVGGLVGGGTGGISNSYVSGSTIYGFTQVGGLAGFYSGTINNSYVTGNVKAAGDSAGGLVGMSIGEINNSYSLANVQGDHDVGGLVGTNYGTVNHTYTAGTVTGGDTTTNGGLIGANDGTVNNSYWNTTNNPTVTTGSGSASSSAGITGLTTAQMQNPFYMPGLNFTSTPGAPNNNWVMIEADGTINVSGGPGGGAFPMLASEYSTSITNAHQLQLAEMNLGANYTLANDINAGATGTPGADVWNSAGFIPISNSNNYFTGSFDGQGHTINGLTIINSQFVGLFGVIDAAGTVSNVHLNGVSIVGQNNVGALAGVNNGTISNSSANGNITVGNYGSGAGELVGVNNGGTITGSQAGGSVSAGVGAESIGGLVGTNSGIISFSSATANVSDITTGAVNKFFGGLVGASNGGSIDNCHSSGDVTTDSSTGQSVGGLIGLLDTTSVDSSFATGNVTGNTNVGGLMGAATNSTVTNSQASTGHVSGQTYVGGLIGSTGVVSISNSSAGGAVTGGSNVGGLIGGDTGSTISDSDATGNVSGSGNNIGGLLGGTSVIPGISPTSITNSSASGNVQGASVVGGLVGLSNGTIDSSHASGTVQGGPYTGGLIGQAASGNISNSYASGAVTDTGGSFAGGLVGDVTSGSITISNSHATGGVTSTDLYIGGLVGELGAGTISGGSYASGTVSGLSFVGGLTGDIGSGSIINSSSSANVTASGSVVDRQNFGGLTGATLGTISNSFATGIVTATGINDSGVGGLAGSNGGSIDTSYATGAVNVGASSNNAGGLAGINHGSISNSSASGVVTVTATVTGETASSIGGLVGSNLGSISNSHATGAVVGGPTSIDIGGLAGSNYGTITGSNASGSASGTGYIGGLVGLDASGTITSSYATGKVTGDNTSYDFGGLVGFINNGAISESYASGSVQGGISVGGLAGETSGSTITDSYAVGNVTGTQSSIGGLVGFNGPVSTIKNCYSAGMVTGAGAGGLTGGNSGTVTNSFWDTTTSKQTTSFGGVGMKTADMQTQANFTSSNSTNAPNTPSWDFGGTWFMYPGQTYPLLQVFMKPLTVDVTNITTTYNGAPFAGPITASYSITPDPTHLLGSLYFPSAPGSTLSAEHVGTYSVAGLYSDQQGYMINYTDGLLTINPLALTVTGQTPTNKVYDGTSAATFVPGSGQLQGVLAGDNVTLNQSGDFWGLGTTCIGSGCIILPQKMSNAGTYSIITSDTLSGNPFNDYVLTQPSTPVNLTMGATITPAPLTVTGLTGTGRAYNGSTVDVLSGTPVLSGLVAGQVFAPGAISAVGALANANVGNQAVTATVTLTNDASGTLASNYSVAPYTLQNTVAITPAPMYIIDTVVQPKVANGSTTATLSGGQMSINGTTVGLYGNDAAGITLTQAGNFVSAAASTTPVAVNAADSISGGNSSDYHLNQPTGLSGTITSPTTVLTVTGEKVGYKIYDGTYVAYLYGGTLVGVASGDSVTLHQQGNFASANADILSVKGASCDGIANISCVPVAVTSTDYITGASVGKYTLQQPGNLSGYIVPAVLIADGTAQNKVYNGNTAATITNQGFTDLFPNYGVVSGQTVNLAESGVFASKNVGNWNVTVTDTISAGAYTTLSNYLLLDPTFSTTASITPATLTYVANGVIMKPGKLPTFGGTVTGFVNGEKMGGSVTSGTLMWTSSAGKPGSTESTQGYYSIIGSGLTATNGNYTFVQASNSSAKPGTTGNNSTALCVSNSAPTCATGLKTMVVITPAPADAVQTVTLPGVQVKDGGVKMPADTVAMN